MASLYEKTYSQVFYTIKSMIKDEDAVFDILQDTYIKAFTHLGTFDGDSKFPSWVRQIAANTARDYLKRKRPALFTELTPEDDVDVPVEERFVDSSSENRPDMVLDQAETARLIREIMDSLPEDQRGRHRYVLLSGDAGQGHCGGPGHIGERGQEPAAVRPQED